MSNAKNKTVKTGMFIRLLPGHEAKIRAIAKKTGKTIARVIEEGIDRL